MGGDLRFLFFGHVFQEEVSFMQAAMDKVQSSYLRSLQEVGDLLKKRAETIKSLKIWTPSHTPRLRRLYSQRQPPMSHTTVSSPANLRVLLFTRWSNKPNLHPFCLPAHLSLSVCELGLDFFFLSLQHTSGTFATPIAHRLVCKPMNLYSSYTWEWGKRPMLLFKNRYSKWTSSLQWTNLINYCT